jgi:enoyl-CoA hydratase
MMSPPDNQFHAWLCGLRPAMEMMLTGDAMDGLEAVRVGFANRAFPAADLDAEVLKVAERIAKIPTDVQQMNKRSVHRALALTTESSKATFARVRDDVSKGLSARDEAFGDYRTRR